MTRALWLEVIGLTLVAAALAAAVPIQAGTWAWSWDGLNHHVYLGLIAQSPRWDLDLLAANYQGYQYPYLYWPVYLLSTLPIGGMLAGALWGAFQAVMLLPPVWLACLHLMPGPASPAQAVFQRAAACALAGSSIVVMAAVGTTGNDPMASVPLLWAVAIMAAPQATDERAAVAAALWGVSTAFKLSNGLALPLLLFWWWREQKPHMPLRRGVLMAVAAFLGFVIAYAPWGWQLWRVKGNPFYPLFGGVFAG